MNRRRSLILTAAAGLLAAAVLAALVAIPTADDRSATTAAQPSPAARPDSDDRRRGHATVRIPAGRYPIGSTASPDESPVHRVALRAFRIDRHEVTNARYVRYLNGLGIRVAGDAEPGAVAADVFRSRDAPLFIEGDEGEESDPLIALDDEHARIGVRDGRFYVAHEWADHPVTEVTWEGARRYAARAGGRLPTEAEWEAAARGRAGRTYPWGDERPTPARAVFGRDSGQTLPVGSRRSGATPQGVNDLAGNVDEWTSSLHRPYPYDRADGREGWPRGSEERVTRGGNHVYSSAHEMRSAYRAGFSREPDRGHRHIGFRVIYPDTR